MKLQRLIAWVAFALAAVCFLLPLVATLELPLRARRSCRGPS